MAEVLHFHFRFWHALLVVVSYTHTDRGHIKFLHTTHTENLDFWSTQNCNWSDFFVFTKIWIHGTPKLPKKLGLIMLKYQQISAENQMQLVSCRSHSVSWVWQKPIFGQLCPSLSQWPLTLIKKYNAYLCSIRNPSQYKVPNLALKMSQGPVLALCGLWTSDAPFHYFPCCFGANKAWLQNCHQK